MSEQKLETKSVGNSSSPIEKSSNSISTSELLVADIEIASINDNFVDSISLTGSSVNDTGSNFGATGEAGEPDHASVSIPLNSVWWSWTAPENGLATIDTFGSDYDTSLGVYTGSAVDNLTTIASNDDAFVGLQSEVSFTAIAGTTYQIAVDGFLGSVGNIELNINLLEAPSNDNFSDSISLTGSSVSDFGTNIAATGEIGEPNHAFISEPLNSVWWSWTAPEDGFFTIDTVGSNYDTSLGVYTGSAVDNLITVASNDDDFFSFQSQVQFEATAGTIYQIAVDGFSGNVGDITLNINPSVATPGNDTIIGTPEDDFIDALAGNDKVFGREGDDFLLGGDGDDLIKGEEGNDDLFGDFGDDELFGGDGDDELFGGDGDDLIKGEDGGDIVFGGNGDDKIFGGEGGEEVFGGDGNDLIKGEDGTDELFGGDGDDKIFGGNGNDELNGDDGEDLLKGGDGVDELVGGEGDDELFGGDGDDFLSGGDGNDLVKGGDDDDEVSGGEGNDTLDGGDGDDFLGGGEGNDTLDGDDGEDDLSGGDGNDLVKGGDDDDFVNGGEGNDTLDGGDGDDFLNGTGFGSIGIGEIDQLTGDDGSDIFVLGDNFDGVFYDDNAASIADSEAGQAIITDFTLGEDKIRLAGSEVNYELVEISGSTQIREISDSIPEAIATVEGVTGLDLADPNQFLF